MGDGDGDVVVFDPVRERGVVRTIDALDAGVGRVKGRGSLKEIGEIEMEVVWMDPEAS